MTGLDGDNPPQTLTFSDAKTMRWVVSSGVSVVFFREGHHGHCGLRTRSRGTRTARATHRHPTTQDHDVVAERTGEPRPHFGDELHWRAIHGEEDASCRKAGSFRLAFVRDGNDYRISGGSPAKSPRVMATPPPDVGS